MKSTCLPRKIKVSCPSDPQRRFWADPAPFRGFIGGVGAGKTFSGAIEVLRQPPGSTGMILAPKWSQMRRGPLLLLKTLAQKAGVWVKYNKMEQEITLVGDRKIWLGVTSDPDSTRGATIGWFWLDEGAQMPADVWPIMLGRLRLGPGRAWLTTTPRGKDWIYDLFVNSGDPNYTIANAPTESNTHNLADYAGRMRARFDQGMAAQELDGQFLDDPTGKLLWGDWLDRAAELRPHADPNRHRMEVEGQRWLSCDAAEGRGGDKTVLLVRDDLGVLHLEASNTMGPEQTAARINELRVTWQIPEGNISIDGGGGVGRQLGLCLERYRIEPLRYYGGGVGGPRFFNLRSAAGWRLRERLEAGTFGLARAGTHLPALRKELDALRYHKTGDKDALITKTDLQAVLGHSPDFFDALAQSLAWVSD